MDLRGLSLALPACELLFDLGHMAQSTLSCCLTEPKTWLQVIARGQWKQAQLLGLRGIDQCEVGWLGGS